MRLLLMRSLCLAAVVAIFACLGFAAGDAPLDRATLKGIQSIAVITDPLDGALQERGVSAGALIKQAEKRLQDAGITVSPDATEFLGIRVMSAQARKTPYAISVSLSVYQRVQLTRDPAVKTATDTWGAQSVVLAQANQVSASVSETIDELVQRFIAAYRSANPAAASAPANPQQ